MDVQRWLDEEEEECGVTARRVTIRRLETAERQAE